MNAALTKVFLYFVARKCLDPIPTYYLGMDLTWHNRSRDLGTRITYTCPFRTSTGESNLISK